MRRINYQEDRMEARNGLLNEWMKLISVIWICHSADSSKLKLTSISLPCPSAGSVMCQVKEGMKVRVKKNCWRKLVLKLLVVLEYLWGLDFVSFESLAVGCQMTVDSGRIKFYKLLSFVFFLKFSSIPFTPFHFYSKTRKVYKILTKVENEGGPSLNSSQIIIIFGYLYCLLWWCEESCCFLSLLLLLLLIIVCVCVCECDWVNAGACVFVLLFSCGCEPVSEWMN